MNICRYVIILFLLFSFCACNRNAKRNKINFQSNLVQVQDSIIRILTLLNKLKDPVRLNKGYDFREDSLFINDRSVNVAQLDTTNALSALTSEERRQLLKLINFLKVNNMSAGSYDTYLGLWTFEYDYLPNGDNNDTRVITLLNDNDKIRISSKAKILDHRQMIFLLKYK